jgi:hypothetical protein
MKHPFPITEQTERSWLNSVGRAFPPWSTLRDDPEDVDSGEPKFLTFARWWHFDVDPLVKSMHQIIHEDLEPLVWNDPGENYIWNALYGMIRALMLRFDQFNGLLDWAQNTWREDPMIQRPFNVKPDDSEIAGSDNPELS